MTHVFQPLSGGFRAPWDGLPPPPRQHAPQADATLQAAVFAGKPAWAAYSESIINSQSGAYTTTWSDQHKVVLHPSSDTTARTFTIDSNANVPYPLGAELVFVNQDSAGVLTIAITSDTMRLAGAGTTGNRSLAANGIARARKLSATEWIIDGTGLT